MEKIINEADKEIILSENPIIQKAMKINSSMALCDKLLEGEENNKERLAILERYHKLSKGYINTLAEFMVDNTKKSDDIYSRFENIIDTLNSKVDDLEYSEFLQQLAYSAAIDPEVTALSLIELAEPFKIQSFVKGILN